MKPRAIVIYGCVDCPHSHDWSSGGLVCTKSGSEKTIIESYGDRKPYKEKTPTWCPLPKVTKLEFNDSI